jgi:CHAT domain-containing protein
VLAACETALVGTRLPDEAIGLPTGLLQAGAAACIGSLWPVPQVSTAILMAFFYGSSGRVSRPRMPSGARRSGCATRPTAS